jgi:hypothetical protein
MKRSIAASAIALGLILGLTACNPYDPGQRAVAGGLYGAGVGAAIGAAATGGPGAPIGAAAGAVAGVLLGAATTPPPAGGYYGYPGYGGYGGYHGYPGNYGYGYPGYAPPQTAAVAPPPTGTVAPSPSTSHDCRTFHGDAIIDGSQQSYYGTACREADGRWHIVH